MRKLTLKRSAWLERQSRALWLSARRQAGFARRAGGVAVARSRCYIAMVPRHLVAEKREQREQILNVINQVGLNLRVGNRVKIDFSRVEKIFPGGMLLLLAALQRLADEHQGKIWARCPPNSLAGQLLNHFGLAKALRVNGQLSKPTNASVVSWSYLTGKQAAGEDVSDLLNRYRNNTEAVIPEGLFAVLTEGLTNVRHHAYTELPDLDESSKKWWLFARIDEPLAGNKGSLFVAIYDMGVGIPSTMRRKLQRKEIVLDLVEKTGRLLSLADGVQLDKRLLFAAVEHKRSQTGQPHRGNGLPEMREFAESTDGGRLHIVSGRAQYSFVPGSQDGQINGFKEEFPGTLLLWSLPLMARESVKNEC